MKKIRNRKRKILAVTVTMLLAGTMLTACTAQKKTEDLPQEAGVEYQVSHYDSYADDGALLYVASFNCPVMTMPGNAKTQEAVNTYMKEMESDYTKQKSYFDGIASENYEAWKAAAVQGETYNYGYTKDKKWDEEYEGFAISRDVMLYISNDKYVSFRVQDNEYLGGANGISVVEGITFDSKTGELMGLQEVFAADLMGAADYIADKVRAELEGDTYQDYLLEDYEDYVDAFFAQDGGSSWYLTDEGFVAVVQENTACAHAAGVIEVTVAWDELTPFQ